MKLNKTLALIFNILILLLVSATLLAVLLLNQSPDYEAELRAQLGDAFFDDLPANLPLAENDAPELEAVIAKYEPHFDALNITALERLEELYTEAVTEYETRQKNGTLDRLKLTSKYIQAGRLLESQVDQRFFILLNHMAAELKRKNLDGSIIAEIEEIYAQTKAEKKKELFNRLRTRLKQ
jgi:hypothetical protein